ncbi:MAG: hypothetical protein QME51_04555, partial [Planctomycetota bacterium]|nr:hypothetical protein [Planctomycetota bacterium]
AILSIVQNLFYFQIFIWTSGYLHLTPPIDIRCDAISSPLYHRGTIIVGHISARGGSASGTTTPCIGLFIRDRWRQPYGFIPRIRECPHNPLITPIF